jgi:hypothetical protein
MRIELPSWCVPNGATAAMIDPGGVVRSALNTAAQEIDRPGAHYRAALTFPPIDDPREGRVVVSRLIRAKRLGLRVEFPLLEPQRVAGRILVDGAGQSGFALAVRGFTARTVVREGWWLSVEAASGQHYLHNVAGDVLPGADGRAVLTLSEQLRAPFADGAIVHLAKPMIEGPVEGSEMAWSISVEMQVGIEVAIEEAG